MTLSFPDYLRTTKAHDNPVGDFIRDARSVGCLEDLDDGIKEVTWSRIENYLYSRAACDAAVCAGRVCWRNYQNHIAKLEAREHAASEVIPAPATLP